MIVSPTSLDIRWLVAHINIFVDSRTDRHRSSIDGLSHMFIDSCTDHHRSSRGEERRSEERRAEARSHRNAPKSIQIHPNPPLGMSRLNNITSSHLRTKSASGICVHGSAGIQHNRDKCKLHMYLCCPLIYIGIKSCFYSALQSAIFQNGGWPVTANRPTEVGAPMKEVPPHAKSPNYQHACIVIFFVFCCHCILIIRFTRGNK